MIQEGEVRLLQEGFYLTTTDIWKCHLISNLQKADLRGQHLLQQSCYHPISDILIPTEKLGIPSLTPTVYSLHMMTQSQIAYQGCSKSVWETFWLSVWDTFFSFYIQVWQRLFLSSSDIILKPEWVITSVSQSLPLVCCPFYSSAWRGQRHEHSVSLWQLHIFLSSTQGLCTVCEHRHC